MIESGVTLGRQVPDFELATYEPARGDFGAFSLARQREAGRWTLIVFYPADFTFV